MKKLFSILIVMCLFASFALADIGAKPADFVSATKYRASASGGLTPLVTEHGKISWSIDGLGTTSSSGTIQVEKPSGATVRKAYMIGASTGFSGYHITNSDITINGNAVTFTSEVPSSISSFNSWADVTSIVKPIVDGSSPGTIDLTIAEANTGAIDGEMLVVIFDDPNQANDNTIILAFGAQNIAGDTFNIGLSDPINKAKPGFQLDMSLGISFSYQQGGVQQYSLVNVNSNRLTTAAGGEDDGDHANGALFTVGGLGDANDNPADPFATDSNPRSDDELYNLIPSVNDGDSSIDAYTQNPSNDDNIFFAGLFLGSTSAVVGEGILLTPVSATNPLGDDHTLTALVQDTLGNPLEGVTVYFEVTSGPNQGVNGTAATNAQGKAFFTYTSAVEGTDTIQAKFMNDKEEWITSNEVEKTWAKDVPPPIPEFTALGGILAVLGVAVYFVVRKK